VLGEVCYTKSSKIKVSKSFAPDSTRPHTHRIIARMASKPTFIGTDTHYPTANGQTLLRIHLDGAASPLACSVALQTVEKLLPHYSNSHSYVHSSAQISTQAFAWAHDTILACLHARADDYTAIFSGSGTTAAINRLARGLAAARSERKVVLVSAMEHHANDLPHRQFDNQVHYFPLLGEGASMGAVDLEAFEALCKTHSKHLNYVALSSVSNVTGIRNPISEIARIAHKYGALVLVDGAQQVAHCGADISAQDVDFFVFSGHKVYTPASPGVLIAKKSVLASLSGQDLGGGSVSTVSYFDYQLLSEYPDKEQSGTPNIVGAVALAKVLATLNDYGFDKIQRHNDALMDELIEGLSTIRGVTVYGTQKSANSAHQRVGAVSFNHGDIDHGLLAAILNDYYAIAVRNECFCAHPYVSSLLKHELWELDLSDLAEAEQEAFINRKRGMVRASLSLYNTSQDVERLIGALQDISEKIDDYRPHYKAARDGSYQHTSFMLDWRAELNLGNNEY